MAQSGGVASAILLAVVGAHLGSLWMLELLLLRTWHGIEAIILVCGWIERKEPEVRLWIINERDEMFAYPYSWFCGIELDLALLSTGGGHNRVLRGSSLYQLG
jgi:hypothetical protein